MKKKSRMYEILGANIVILLLVSSLITIAIETYEEETDLKMVHPSEITSSGNQYEGRLRVYVVEIESRWDMENRHPYHNALFDFAYDDDLFIPYLMIYLYPILTLSKKLSIGRETSTRIM